MKTVDDLKKMFNVIEDQELAPIFNRKKGAVSVWRKKGVPPSIELIAQEKINQTGNKSANLALHGDNHHIDVHNGTAAPLAADIAYLVSLLEGKDREQIQEVIRFAMGIK